MAFNFLSLPAELRTIMYEDYYENDIDAPGLPHQQVLMMRLPGHPLAQTSRQIRAESHVLTFSRMQVAMNLTGPRTSWPLWLENVSADYLACIRKLVIIGHRRCNGVQHDRIVINLDNPNDPVTCGNQVPQVRLQTCACVQPYQGSRARATRILRANVAPGGALVMTKWKLERIFKAVYRVTEDILLDETIMKH